MLTFEKQYWGKNLKYDERLRVCQKIIEIDITNVESWYCKAESLEKLDRIAESINAYEFLLKIDSNKENQIQEKIKKLTS